MLLTPIAVIAGLVTGLLRGGRFENLLNASLTWAPVVVFGFIVQSAAELIDVPARLSVFIVGAFVLIVGLCQNLHIRGMAIVVLGLSSNLIAAVANGYVPVRLEALIGAGKVDATIDPDTVVSIGALGQLQDEQTQLGFLGDIVPIGLINDVVSFGDLILIAGLFVLAMNLVTRRPRAAAAAPSAADEARPGLDSSGLASPDLASPEPNTSDGQGSNRLVIGAASGKAIDLRSTPIAEPLGAEIDSGQLVEAHRAPASDSSDSGGITPDEFLAELAAADDGSRR